VDDTTVYFRERVLRDRPYLTLEICRAVVTDPVRREIEDNGRIRHWAFVQLPDLGRRALRVVTLEDGVTIHTAFPDRRFREAGHED
jgi:hypothetical protein